MAVLSRLQVFASQITRRGLENLERRAYGSAAAQLLYDDDHYYDGQDEEEERRKTSRNWMLDSDGWVPGRGVQWVLIGDRGAKKHLYAERHSKLLEVPHISMGSLVRQELNPRSSLYKHIANAVNERKLVPDEVILALLSKRLEEGCYRGENGFILEQELKLPSRWKITTENRTNSSIFRSKLHPEKPGRGCWLRFIFSV